MDTDVGTAISTGGFVNPYSETATNVFDAANRLTSTTNGNASVSTFGYDSANRTTSVVHKTSGSTTLASYQYSYDNASNVSTRTDSDGTVTTFGYDASDQLTSEVRDNSHGTGYSISLAYDHNGNRTSKVQGGVTTTSVYDHHDKLTSAGSKSYGYDSNGNCTTVTVGTSVTTLTYDIENRIVGISYPGGASNSFAYNGEDLRTKKVDSTGTQNYVCDGDSPGSALLKDGNAVYTPGLSERRGSTSKFYHGDALGSTRGITDSTQAVTDSVLYDAFGNTVTRTGTTPTPFGFVGKAQYQSDSDSGLQLLGHRYYDPSIGRFLSSDPIQDGTNWYVYCDDNPLNGMDPTGLEDTMHLPPGLLPPFERPQPSGPPSFNPPPSIIPPYLHDPSFWFGPGATIPSSGQMPGGQSGTISVGVGGTIGGGGLTGTVSGTGQLGGGYTGTVGASGLGGDKPIGNVGVGIPIGGDSHFNVGVGGPFGGGLGGLTGTVGVSKPIGHGATGSIGFGNLGGGDPTGSLGGTIPIGRGFQLGGNLTGIGGRKRTSYSLTFGFSL